MKIEFEVLGKPIPNVRRTAFAKKRGKVFSHLSPKTANWRAVISYTAQIEVRNQNWELTNKPVHIDLIFSFMKPKSWRKKDNIPFKKPDWENLIKPVCDSLTGIIYTDDARICSWTGKKIFSDRNFVRIKIEEL